MPRGRPATTLWKRSFIRTSAHANALAVCRPQAATPSPQPSPTGRGGKQLPTFHAAENLLIERGQSLKHSAVGTNKSPLPLGEGQGEGGSSSTGTFDLSKRINTANRCSHPFLLRATSAAELPAFV